MEKSKITYAQAIAEVEQILERFNNEQMNAELIRLCKERLRKAEKEVDEALKEEE